MKLPLTLDQGQHGPETPEKAHKGGGSYDHELTALACFKMDSKWTVLSHQAEETKTTAHAARTLRVNTREKGTQGRECRNLKRNPPPHPPPESS